MIINSKIINLIDYRLDIMAVDKWAVADPGEGPGRPAPPLPLFLGQTEARRAEKKFWRPPPYLKVWNRHWSEQSVKGVTT